LVPGAVVWAHVPFAEIDEFKTRPAVVVEIVGREVTILPATSSSSRSGYPTEYVELRDLNAAGLNRPTGVRLRETTVDIIEIVDVVGRLSDIDRKAILSPVCASGEVGGRDAAAAPVDESEDNQEWEVW
jgi:hypothetical protein